jgi:CheY-like chemotaxis protein
MLRTDVGNTWARRMHKPIVLVVDDEALIRISAVHIVEEAGFSTLEASNADDAIKLLEERPDIRAVFTDISMSGSMDGFKLAHAIRERWPPIHLIVTSGLKLPDKLPVKGRFIPKPYSAEQVAAALHELFGHDPAPEDINSASCEKRAKLA